MTKRRRSAFATILALSLVLTTPGGPAYRAAAQTLSATTAGSASSASGAVGSNLGAGGVSSVPTFTGSNLGLAPTLNAASIVAPDLKDAVGASILPGAMVPAAGFGAFLNASGVHQPSVASPAGLKAATPSAAKAVVPTAKTPAATMPAALGLTLPAAGKSDDSTEKATVQAAKEFDGSTFKPEALSVLGVSGFAASKSGLKKGESKGTPEQVDENGVEKPNGPVDGLGNPTRQGGEHGPDDDREGGERSGNVLFSNLGIGLAGGAMMGAAALSLGSLSVFPLIIISLILHEIGHARVADKLGDPTARLQNRASLNPKHWLTHIDLVWTILIPLSTYLSFGFVIGGAKPVPVQSKYFRDPVKGQMWVSVAGPAVNVGLAVAGALALTGALAAGLGAGVVAALGTFVFLNVLLAVFNLLPYPTLDGSYVLRGLLSPRLRSAYDGFVSRLSGNSALLLPLIVVSMFAGWTGLLAPLGVGLLVASMLPFDAVDAVRSLVPAGSRAGYDRYVGKVAPYAILTPLFALTTAYGGLLAYAGLSVSKLLVGGFAGLVGLKLAASAPALATAASLMLGQVGAAQNAPAGEAPAATAAAPRNPDDGPGAASSGSGPVDLIVLFGDEAKVRFDAHISQVDVNLPNGVGEYTRLQQSMLAQLEAVGVDAATLEPYQGTPRATYKRINAATIRVEGGKAAEFARLMESRGFKVYTNSRREIIRPITIKPEDMDPSARNAVTMEENAKIVKAEGALKLAEQMWGKPDMGSFRRAWNALFGSKTEAPQPKLGVIDSGADLTHPQLKRVKEVKNMTSGENVDDIGHGSWVTSMVLFFARWSKNTTHYKTFLNGGATLDDILKSLTQAGNDGNLVISNSWGDDEGDPNGPDSQLVRKLAQEGHIMVFAAGNAGSGKNTVGAPAIVTYKDESTGAIRVVSVAAAGRDKRVAYFSSRGPGSPKTSKDPNYKDHRPDLTAVGYNIEGAWPANLGDADRTDGDNGTVKAISGTSMSTPGVAGAISLLAMLLGVTEVGPKLDAIVVAVMSTLEKTGKNSRDEEGEGFLNVDAALQKLLPSRSELAAQRKSFTGAPSADFERADRLRRYLDVAEYKSLLKKQWDLTLTRAELLKIGSQSRRYDGDVGDELLQRVENEVEPDLRAVEARIRELETNDPYIRYHAASRLEKWWMRRTGRGPKS